MEKTILQRFANYSPDSTTKDWLDNATNISMRANRERRIIEIHACFDWIMDKEDLYRIEDGITKAHNLGGFKIMPKYPGTLFTADYVPQVIMEAERVGVVAKGFFRDFKYDLDLEGSALEIRIPLVDGGVTLLYDANTPVIISRIINSEFGLDINVTITTYRAGELPDSDRIDTRIDILNRMDAEMNAAALEYGKHDYTEHVAPQSDTPQLPTVRTLFEDQSEVAVENNICKIGNCQFDISEPEYLLGNQFRIEPTPIATVTKAKGGTVIIGETFGFTKEESRNGDKMHVTFSIYDGNSSIEIVTRNMEKSDAKELEGFVKDGATLAIKGYAKEEQRMDGTKGELIFHYSSIAKIKKIKRSDSAEQKRVELHLHTQMSAMDALIPPDQIVYLAKEWGHKAVALTDHGNVQGFPEAMKAADKCGMKVIYGMEAYFVNDTVSALSGDYHGTFDGEMIVFDIETTGLSPITCKIIEIGAVKIKDGAIIDTFNTFVNPGVPISEEITRLTSIDDSMVADAPDISEALPAFFSFVDGNKLLIAHNASFDISFIRQAAKELDIQYDFKYLDTVALSRFLNSDIKNHKLDTVAKYYGLHDFHHHRACDDAEILAHIYFAMCSKMRDLDITSFDALQKEMMLNADPLQLKPYHQVILVRNLAGLKNLYKLISMSYLQYYRRSPRIPKSVLEKHRDGLLIGSACEAGELYRALLENRTDAEIEEIVGFYDYLEIQPICNNRFLIEEGTVKNDDALRQLNKRIVELGKKYSKPVVATCDAHYVNDEDDLYRRILLTGMKFKDANKEHHLFFRTTEEMLEEFNYLGKETAYEVVVTNTNLIADMIADDVRPIPHGTYTPKMEGAEEDLQNLCWSRAKRLYGDPVPEIVATRLQKELDSIIKHGFAVLYMIAQKLVHYSESQGYLVGSRGSVGSSLAASMSGISEVNPLPPHYYCPKCQYSKFFTDGTVGSGFDLPDAVCPECGTKLIGDGHDIPFETFLGFYGDKSPDIDLNFSGDVQGRVHKYTEELFGAENVFKAGTLGTLADKTAFGFVKKYLEDRGIALSRAETNRIVNCCVGVKRTTGQHPGGIIVVPREYEVYDFTPVQHPADDPKSDIVTTHFAFSYLHDTILKLDELGHDIPTKYKWLERFSDTSVMDVKMNDPSVYELFASTKPLGVTPEDIDTEIGTYGLPEMGTRFIQQVLIDAKPKNFADLMQISGLTHGTDVWLGNAQTLIKDGICDISKVIGTRDGIMLDLIRYGLDNGLAFKIMESVRKGKGLTPEWMEEMRAHNVPEWYIGSCLKIKYMFPKAHAAAYVMSAIRLGWYKVHMPIVFYSAMFTVAPGGFDAEVVGKGRGAVRALIKEIETLGKKATQKEQGMIPSLQLANECMARGIRFLPVNIEKSDAYAFLPENGSIRMPFSSLGGLGESAAQSIINERNKEPFFSIEDLRVRAKLSKSVIEILKRCGALDGMSDTDQLSMF
ncbi:MAG: PolC-type DNA polymerase III [Clostridia bacterium]|nr:PolC-type DNA polymerase III [Clostridia bacterium]